MYCFSQICADLFADAHRSMINVLEVFLKALCVDYHGFASLYAYFIRLVFGYALPLLLPGMLCSIWFPAPFLEGVLSSIPLQ